MKICLIIPSFYPAVVYGGPIFSTLHTCEELSSLSDTEVFVSTTNTNMTSKLDVPTNEWQKFNDYFYVKYYDETIVDKFSLQLFMNVWRDIKASDVVHIQAIFNTPTPISLLYATLLKKPIILSPRGSLGLWCLEHGNTFKKNWLNWFIKPFANKVVWHATAEQEKNEILAIFPDARVEIIPNGIEYEKFQNYNVLTKKEFLKKYTGKDLNIEKVIISMGRLQKKKGFDILIDSFAKILEKYPDAKLLIAGQDEGEEKNLKRQIQESDLIDKAFLIGPIDGQDKIDFYANADLFVLPSHNENFGNVYIESLAAGTPIVASTNTPWKEVEEVDCGKWVVNNVKETSDAMIEMIERDREQMRINAKGLAQKYDWKNIAIQFKNLYEELSK